MDAVQYFALRDKSKEAFKYMYSKSIVVGVKVFMVIRPNFLRRTCDDSIDRDATCVICTVPYLPNCTVPYMRRMRMLRYCFSPYIISSFSGSGSL
jgi:hypothetical protein